MYRIILISPGPNRLQLISKVAINLDIDRADAKKLVDTPNSAIGFGDYRQVAKLLDQYGDLGADLDYGFWPEAMHPETWASTMSSDTVTCSDCGHRLFYCVPGLTTEDELHEAVRNSAHVYAHPGVYCPNCGRSVTVNLGEPLSLCRYRPRWIKHKV